MTKRQPRVSTILFAILLAVAGGHRAESMNRYAAGVVQPSNPVMMGTYACQGETMNSAGLRVTYQIDLTVEPLGDTYKLTWSEDGLQAHIGFGFVQDRRLISVFFNQVSVGVVSYDIEGGQLLGRWTGGDGHLYPERCLRGSPAN